MADSKDKNDTSSENFADDLDAMLNDAESLIDDQDEMIDDEDAIDRLLMDDAFDVAEEDVVEDNVDQIIEPSLKKETTKVEQDTFDEFAEDEQVDSIIEDAISANNDVDQNNVDEFDVDDLMDSVVSDLSDEEDVFAEIDELSDNIIEPEPEPEPEDDFLMADFDISSDDDDDDVDNILDEFAGDESFPEAEPTAATTTAAELIEDSDEEEPELAQEKTDILTVAPPLPDTNIEKIKTEVESITAQLGQLWAEKETLAQKIDEIASLNEKDSTAEEIDSLKKEQQKLRKSIKENEAKVPVISYVAIGIAVLALLIGGGLGAIGYGAQSDVTELTELVATLEEEIEFLAAKDATAEIKKTNEKIVLLLANDDDFNKQIESVNTVLQSDKLKLVVDDLVKQNDRAQEAIELLLAKVETLEKGKVVTKNRKKPKKLIPKVVWVVNLVSFKQEWYAKRKAAEFEKKGVPAEVMQAKVNGENWFRLRVTGFKNKYEAAAYAVKVKKTLNLSSVWVTQAK